MAGLVIAAVITYVHAKIAALGSGYTSFCNVNESINCDQVLASPFGKLLGVPIAWFAMATYGALAAVFWLARSPRSESNSAYLRLAFAGVAGAAAFSTYMAGISLFVLHTICLLCTGLYLVTATLVVVVGLAIRTLAKTTSVPSPWPTSARGFVSAVAAAAVLVSAVAYAAWPRVESRTWTRDPEARFRRAAPEFYSWYLEQPIMAVPVSTRNVMGAEDAPVTIVEFADLQCGHCRASHERLKHLLERRPGEVRVIYRHFPLDAACNEVVDRSIHSNACRAAEAAECAGLQGHFADMLDVLFEHQTQLFESNLPRLAKKAGLDMAAFNTCMETNQTRPLVVEDCRAGDALDIKSTPTLFFNGREIMGTFDREINYDYAVLIETRLKQEQSQTRRDDAIGWLQRLASIQRALPRAQPLQTRLEGRQILDRARNLLERPLDLLVVHPG